MLAAALMLGGCMQTESQEEKFFSESGDAGEEYSVPDLNEILTALPREKQEEICGVWISYLELSPRIVGKTEEEFTKLAEELCQNCRNFGFQTIFLQIRPFADSFYPSEYYPWSSYAGGAIGLSPGYDPVGILLDCAAEQRLSVHGWINPMRGFEEEEIGRVSDEYLIRQWYDDPVLRGQNLFVEDGVLYLNPGSADARELIINGALEALERYQLDGIHIDDYFYPPSLPLSADETSYLLWQEAGGTLSQEDWRRENTYIMVKELSEAVHQSSGNAMFGVSPRAVLSQNYNDLYIDVEKWMAEPGCLDYIAPQIYFGFENESAPFAEIAAQWDALCTAYQVPLVAGLAAYKVGQQDAYAGSGSGEWAESPDILRQQADFLRTLDSFAGMIFFRYDNFADGTAESLFSVQSSTP